MNKNNKINKDVVKTLFENRSFNCSGLYVLDEDIRVSIPEIERDKPSKKLTPLKSLKRDMIDSRYIAAQGYNMSDDWYGLLAAQTNTNIRNQLLNDPRYIKSQQKIEKIIEKNPAFNRLSDEEKTKLFIKTMRNPKGVASLLKQANEDPEILQDYRLALSRFAKQGKQNVAQRVSPVVGDNMSHHMYDFLQTHKLQTQGMQLLALIMLLRKYPNLKNKILDKMNLSEKTKEMVSKIADMKGKVGDIATSTLTTMVNK